MNTKLLLAILPVNTDAALSSGGNIEYLIGGVLALLILGYLVYTLLHPEKF